MAEIKTEKKSLRYDFKAREIHDLSLELAAKNKEFVRLENESKAVASQYGSKLKTIKAEVGELSNKVADGWESREIECDIEYHKPEKGKKTVTRKDDMHSWVEPMESWEWNLFNQDPNEDEEQRDGDIEDAEVVEENNGPKLLEN